MIIKVGSHVIKKPEKAPIRQETMRDSPLCHNEKPIINDIPIIRIKKEIGTNTQSRATPTFR
jgi:hypothetical protein